MADSRDDPRLFIVDPEHRGVFPLDAIHLPRRLKRTLLAEPFEVTIDTAFAAVMRACAEPAPGRPNTWINQPILDLYCGMHELGHAHSVECWTNGELVGGLYGVHLQSAFFGESMFSRRTDASKVAFMHLAARLRRQGFRLLDAQFVTEHLSQFGALEISRAEFRARLKEALRYPADFGPPAQRLTGADVVQLITQTS
ncbi:leucyl/phenylalanyl-tRNA--protein transferase [bacterium]|nr:leucyl/phenylalanyl-tRNA--protein transferase [bacterium]